MFKKIFACFVISTLLFTEMKTEAISAKSAVLYEPVSKRILFSKNENEQLPMASTTKIVTAITAIENCDISRTATTSYKASVIEGSSIWLEEGEKMNVEDLLYGLLLSSGNDAATVIAEHVSGSVEEFSKLMNNTAKKAGAQNSNFTNPSGLDDKNHYTTALDLAKITAYAMENPTFRKIVATKSKTIPWEGHEWDRQLKNHNKLLTLYDGANGVKTGFTKKDGRCLVGSAERNGINLITVTLNAPDDWNDHMEMLDYGFSELKTKSTGINDYVLKVDGGEKDATVVKSKFVFNIPYKIGDVIETKTALPKSITSPVKSDKEVGFEEVYLNGCKIYEIPIVTTENIDEKFVPDFIYYLREIIRIILPV